MLCRLFGKKENMEPTTEATIDVFLDNQIYERFRALVARKGIDEGAALVEVLDRGMTNYWVQEFKQLKQDYPHLKKLCEECDKDNKKLRALERQNEYMKRTLEDYAAKKNTDLKMRGGQ